MVGRAHAPPSAVCLGKAHLASREPLTPGNTTRCETEALVRSRVMLVGNAERRFIASETQGRARG